ncbi:MAG: hypothetical protein HY912_05465 [Desulfomonile tiedjei]|uniref:Uncharacterized protein n=1 Tax=Desulfomonile tiedjei TaxID=2358 RepID=A0A9D6Z2L5_9BACT|nr:hypothetical protein [Desulfomonile tiedjei]
MKFFLTLALIVSACLPSHVAAQTPCLGTSALLSCPGALQESPTEGTKTWAIAGLPGLNLGKIALNPFVQVGYQKVASNISFPIQVQQVIPVDNTLQIGTMELLLQDASFWTGIAGLNVVLNPTWSLFSAVGGFVPRDVIAPSILPIRINGITLPSRIDFTGDNVEYWFIQAGASYAIGGGWSLLAGYFWDHFGMVAVDPRIGQIPFPNQSLRADFLTKTAVPFLGIGLTDLQLKYKASIIYSPLAQSRCLMASRSSQGGTSQLLYTFNKPGQFLAANMEYDSQLSKEYYMSFWAAASWVKVTGGGSFEFSSAVVNGGRSESGASISKYSLGGGIGLGMVF